MAFELILVYLGGILTIFAPCVLPVVPFVFTKSDKLFRRTGLPILIGMAATFTVLASVAAVGGAWIIQVNQYGRYAAMLLLFVFGLALIFPTISDRLMKPFVRLGGLLQDRAGPQESIQASLLLGVAIGFLWAPCAGPILGLVLADAALNGASLHTALLLLFFAAGAATSLGIALLAGTHVLNFLKRGFRAEEWIRRGIGVAVIISIVVIALGWDTKVLAQLSYVNTTNAEQQLIQQLRTTPARNPNSSASQIPSLVGATSWLNSQPLTQESLEGKVVLIDFWTYSCINCIRTLPYIKAWDTKYRDKGLVIIGVHSPEFGFEKSPENVQRAVTEFNLKYPIALDNNFAIWNAFNNHYWPAHYLFDAQGQRRDTHFGEGDYEATEKHIQALLREANPNLSEFDHEPVNGTGASAPSAQFPRSPETYVGYARQNGFSSNERIIRDQTTNYTPANRLALNQWALAGSWLIQADSASLQSPTGALSYHFEGRDLHLVMGSRDKKPIRFRVTLDGKAPGESHGGDINAEGYGVLNDERLYQLIRQDRGGGGRFFKIEFLDTGAVLFAFTFG